MRFDADLTGFGMLIEVDWNGNRLIPLFSSSFQYGTYSIGVGDTACQRLTDGTLQLCGALLIQHPQ